MNSYGDTVQILLIEDDEVEVRAFRRAMDELQLQNPLITASDGQEALGILRGDMESSIRNPFLILLDMNMPRMNGTAFLKELRSDERLADSIVFVLSTSDTDGDRSWAYRHNVAGYLVKTRASDELLILVQMLRQYWSTVRFPVLPEIGRKTADLS